MPKLSILIGQNKSCDFQHPIRMLISVFLSYAALKFANDIVSQKERGKK